MKDYEKIILDYLDKNGKITDEKISELCSLKRIRTFIIAKEMCDKGLMMAISKGTNKLYIRLK